MKKSEKLVSLCESLVSINECNVGDKVTFKTEEGETVTGEATETDDEGATVDVDGESMYVKYGDIIKEVSS